MSPEIVADLVSLATTSNPYSCRKLAQHVQAEYGVRVSSETIRRYLGQAGMKHGLPRYVPALTPLHRQKRVAFAQKHVKRTSFSSWMFTDSQKKLLSKAQSKQGVKVWYAKGARPIVQVKHGTLGLNVYIGVTKYGITEPCFVTGAGSHKSSYANTRTGAMYRGVCAAEYQEQVLPHLVKEGNLVFAYSQKLASSWVFQQDDAPIHKAKGTITYLDSAMPGRWVKDWPPRSPDLSWVENIWAWAEHELQTNVGHINNIQDLQRELKAVLRSAKQEKLQSYVNGMTGRLKEVIKQDRASIGK